MSKEQIKPAAWQFYQNGEWRTGMETNNHRQNTEEGGFPVRDLYAIPEGYALVPVEPTEEMLKAAIYDTSYDGGGDFDATIGNWKAMIKAYQDATFQPGSIVKEEV